MSLTNLFISSKEEIKTLIKQNIKIDNQMAKVIGVTEGTVRNRIQKLIQNKVIKISVINNINRLENPSLAFVGLDVETRSKDSVAKALSKMKEVRFPH